LKKTHIDGRMEASIVPQLSQRQLVMPLLWVVHCHTPQIVLLTLSVWPSVCGWYDELISSLTPNSLNNSFQKRLVNTLSLSVTVVVGNP